MVLCWFGIGFRCKAKTENSILYAALEIEFVPEVVSVVEGTSAIAVVCIQYLNSDFQQDVSITLQTQDGSAIGE